MTIDRLRRFIGDMTSLTGGAWQDKDEKAIVEVGAKLLGELVAAIGDPRLSHRQELSSPWAITTLEQAAAQWPGSELVFVVGSDLAAQIPSWKQAEAVLKACVLAIAPRAGWPLQPKQLEQLTQLGGRVVILPLQVPATASSALRQTPDPAQLPAALLPLLLKHNLSGLAGDPNLSQPQRRSSQPPRPAPTAKQLSSANALT